MCWQNVCNVKDTDNVYYSISSPLKYIKLSILQATGHHDRHICICSLCFSTMKDDVWRQTSWQVSLYKRWIYKKVVKQWICCQYLTLRMAYKQCIMVCNLNLRRNYIVSWTYLYIMYLPLLYCGEASASLVDFSMCFSPSLLEFE